MKPNHSIKHAVLLMMLMLPFFAVQAQDKKAPETLTISGKVTDEYGEPLPGVNVAVEGTKVKTTTDIDGMYSIAAKMGNVLIFEYIGFKSQAVTVTTETINITLYEDSATLDEVVVEAYGDRDTRVEKALKGRAEGVAVTTAEPAAASIRIRGASSVSSGDIAPAAAAEYVTESSPSARYADSAIPAGQLTAGEVNDFSKWEYWQGLTTAELSQWQKHWAVSPSKRFSVIITNKKGYPLPNKVLSLTDNRNTVLWTARTDNTGRAELWYHPAELNITEVQERLYIIDENKKVLVKNPDEYHNGINTYAYDEACSNLKKVNIAFMVDATGSMGDEISYLQAELNDVITRAKDSMPGMALSMGSVFYRDSGDSYVTSNFNFTQQIPDIISFINNQSAGGGGDYPEAVVEGFENAIDSLTWDEDAAARLLFVMLDAPPHHHKKNLEKLNALAERAAAKGIRIVPVAASGTDKSTEYLMRAMALMTNGTYLFITNHSGIGNNHIEPSTDTYKVEMLNALLLRVIMQFTETNNCKTEADYAVNTKLEEEVKTNPRDIAWSHYPNPATGPVTIDIDTEATALYLFDTTGKLIMYKDEKTKKYQINLTGLSNGIYYLKITCPEKELFGKIIKKS